MSGCWTTLDLFLLSANASNLRSRGRPHSSGCVFQGGGGDWSGFTILKGAAEYVPADFGGSIGHITIDVETARDIRHDKVNNALRLLLGHNPLVNHFLAVWDTHQDDLTQPSQERERNVAIPPSFPTIPCPLGRTGDSSSNVQGLILLSGMARRRNAIEACN